MMPDRYVSQMTPITGIPAITAAPQANPLDPEHRLKVIVVWDGTTRTSYPPDLYLPPGSLITLPPGTLAAYQGPDALLDELVQLSGRSPTLILSWQGLPRDTVRQLEMTARILGRDRVVTLPSVFTPMAALSIGWRIALLANSGPLDVRHARLLGLLLGSDTQSVVVLRRPHKSRALDLKRGDLFRSFRAGTKVVRWVPEPVVAHHSASAPLLDRAERVGRLGGPRLLFIARSGDPVRLNLGVVAEDAVVEMKPGSLDSDAWGQKAYTDIAVSPRGINHVVPAVTGDRMCLGCERLVPQAQPFCDWCTLPN